ncbi:hypothetical protein ACRAWD_02265 [Caulobacter segnis]
MFELAQRNGITLPYGSVDEIRAAYAFSNLQDFLDIYYQGAGVLQTAEDFKDLALAYFKRLAADGVDPRRDLLRPPDPYRPRASRSGVVSGGLPAGMDEAERTLGVTSKLILCFTAPPVGRERLRDPGTGQALAEQAGRRRPGQLRGLGHPPARVRPRSRKRRVTSASRSWPHAGRRPPDLRLGSALDLVKVDRIDHGSTRPGGRGAAYRTARSGRNPP